MSDTRYVYIYEKPQYVAKGRKKPKKGFRFPITVAYRFDDEEQRIVYNYAECGKKDHFCRRIGRTVASNRLAANPEKHTNKTLGYGEVSTSGGPKYSLISMALTNTFGGAQKALSIKKSVLNARPEGQPVRYGSYREPEPFSYESQAEDVHVELRDIEIDEVYDDGEDD